MRISPVLRLPVAFLVALALALSAAPGQAQTSVDQDIDYLVLSRGELRALAAPVRVLSGPVSGKGELVAYTAFNSQIYQLNRFRGRYVDLMVPLSWSGPGGLSGEQIRDYVDRTDVTYQHFLDLVGAHPEGEGPMPIAIVPDTCGGGCGLLGFKGVEMFESPHLLEAVSQEIAADIPSGIFIHEMTHNFDFFSPFVAAYLADPPHGWTSFLSFYYFAYAHEGFLGQSPEEITRRWLLTTGPYFKDPTADWESCVRDNRCREKGISDELAWGGFPFRLALLDGAQSVRGSLAFLRGYGQSHAPSAIAEEQSDLYLEALAAGSRRNLSCVADAWRWPLSGSLRMRMRRLYPAANPDCQDRDRDGFSPVLGDCNDRRAAVHPGAPERLRRVDDDCDGLVDETDDFEPGATPWPPPPWARTAPTRRSGNRFVLTAASALARAPGPNAEVRFWVSGQGFVGKVPYSRAASFAWAPPAGLDPVAEGLTYRAQILVRGVPAYGITRGQPFAAP
jgi:hypothetical protein